jgi:hypothetical protein
MQYALVIVRRIIYTVNTQQYLVTSIDIVYTRHIGRYTNYYGDQFIVRRRSRDG